MADPHHAYRPTRWRGFYQTWTTVKFLQTPLGSFPCNVLTVIREPRGKGGGSAPIPWDVLQTIKDEILGPDVYAIEVYPPQGEIVAEEYRRHLWAIPEELRTYFPNIYRG